MALRQPLAFNVSPASGTPGTPQRLSLYGVRSSMKTCSQATSTPAQRKPAPGAAYAQPPAVPTQGSESTAPGALPKCSLPQARPGGWLPPGTAARPRAPRLGRQVPGRHVGRRVILGQAEGPEESSCRSSRAERYQRICCNFESRRGFPTPQNRKVPREKSDTGTALSYASPWADRGPRLVGGRGGVGPAAAVGVGLG